MTRGRTGRVLAAFLGAALFLATLSSGAAPAKADLGDCFNALVPVGSAAKLAEVTGKIDECGTEATSNPMMAVVMAVMITLRAEGLFSTSDDCNKKVDALAGQLIGVALKAFGIQGSDIEGLILGQLSLSQIPGLGDTLLHFTSCGCAIAGALDDAKAIADEYVNSVQGCGEFSTEAVADIASGIFNSGWFGHGAGSPGTIDEPPVVCSAGLLGKTPVLNQCVNGQDANGVGITTCSWDKKTYAPAWLNPPIDPNSGAVVPCYCEGGSWLTSLGDAFICKCPSGQGYHNDGSCTPCPAGQATGDDGQCRAGQANELKQLGSWVKCGGSQVAYQTGNDDGFCGPKCDGGTKISNQWGLPKCIPACGAGSSSLFTAHSVFDQGTKQCTDCAALGQVAVFDDGKGGNISSNGYCKSCDAGYKFSDADPKHPKCVPVCDANSILNDQGTCDDCNKKGLVAVHSQGKGSFGTCEACTPIIEKRVGNTCGPAVECSSWQNLTVRGAGAFAAATCVSKCAAGEKFTPGRPGGSNTVHDKISGKTFTTITVPVLESCKPCGDKEILDPATNTCGSCPTEKPIWHPAAGGKPSYCDAPPKLQPVGVPKPTAPIEVPNKLPGVVQPQRDPPVGECPPGRVRNAAGTRCVVEADSDEGFRGGSSGGGRPGGTGGGSVAPAPAPAPSYRSPGGKP